MSENMKRKQFHLSIAEEKVIYDTAQKYNISEAEVVRMAIQEFDQRNKDAENSLIRMSREAKLRKSNDKTDLSASHDKYLAEMDNV